MEVFAGPLLILIIVILIVSLAYLIITTKHKEKMSLLEKGHDPKDLLNTDNSTTALRIGLFLIGVGFGFLAAFIFDEFIMIKNENPAIYPAMILIFGGISQILFIRIKKK